MNKRCKIYFILVFTAVLLFPALGHTASFSDTRERAVNCGVPQTAVDSVVSLVNKGNVTDEQAALLLSPLLEACVEQLPVSPLADKLAEGAAKRVSPLLIARALGKRLESYQFARELLLTKRGDLAPEALTVVGTGVDEGVSREDFEVYVSEFGKQSPDVFLTGLIMVSLQGQAAYDAVLTRRIIRQGISSESLDGGWRYFVRIILAARERGITDAAVANGAVGVLRNKGIVSDVMEELGFTGRDLGDEEEN